MTQEDNIPSVDRLSPRYLLLQVTSAINYLRSKWLAIALFALGAGCFGGIIAYLKDPLYKAEITFAVDDGSRPSAKSEFSTFSEQLGLGTVDGGTVFNNVKNIEELLKSRLLIEKTLRCRFTAGDSSILFADFFLDSLEYRQEWVKESAYPDFRFNIKQKDTAVVLFENGLINRMYKMITKEFIQIAEKSKKGSINSVSCITKHQLFSKYFLEQLVSEVKYYYIESKTKRAKLNLSIIEQRNDSVRRAYIGAVYGRSAFSDADINLVRDIPAAPLEKKQTDVQILRAAYIDLSRNIETAKTSLMNETPLFDIIDTPILPLDVTKPSLLKNFLLFGIIGSLLFSFYLLGARFLRHLAV